MQLATLLAEADLDTALMPDPPDVPVRALRTWDRVVAHRGWLAVRDRALAGLARRPALVVILGEAGVGKTILLHEMARVLAASGIANVVLSSSGSTELWQEIDPKSVLLIDDADRFDDESLRHLSADDRRLVVVAERPAFAERIIDLPLSTTLLDLAPLTRREIAGFLIASLPEEDRATPLFSDAAIDRLAARSAGVPRRLHDLAGTALFLARRERMAQANARHVDQAALVGDADMDVPPARPPALVVARSLPAPHVTLKAAPYPVPEKVAASAPREAVLIPLTLPVASQRNVAPAPGRRHLARLGFAAAFVAVGAAAGMALMLQAHRIAPAPPVPVVAARPVPPPPAAAAPKAPAPEAMVTDIPPPARIAPSVAFREPFSPALPLRPAAAPAPAPETAAAEVAIPPSAALTRVLIGFPPNAPRAARAATTLAAELRKQGFWVAEPAATVSRTKPGVWFGFTEDRDAALRIAAALPNRGGAPTPRAQPSERGEPPIPGTVQIMISSEGDLS